MSNTAFDHFALTRIADFARSLSLLHQASRRQVVDDDAIDREFNAVCLSVWGYTTDDFSDELFSEEDHAWLDALDEAHARIFAAEQGYDLVDDNGMLTDWWGYCWMILAEKRGLLTPENRAAANALKYCKTLALPIDAEVLGARIQALAEADRLEGWPQARTVASWFETALVTMRVAILPFALRPGSPVSKPSSVSKWRAARPRGLPQLGEIRSRSHPPFPAPP